MLSGQDRSLKHCGIRGQGWVTSGVIKAHRFSVRESQSCEKS